MSLRRSCPCLIAAVLVAALASAGPARAGEYTVAQCDPRQPGFEDARFTRTHGGDYSFSKRCADGAGLQVRSISGAPAGRRGRISFAVPDGTGIVALRVEGRLRRHEGHRARLALLARDGSEAARIGTGGTDPSPFERHSDRVAAPGAAAFAVTLSCGREPRCPQSDLATARVRSLRLTLLDRLAPEIETGGSLLASGWLRGSRRLEVAGRDVGSGLRRIEATIGGKVIPPTRSFDCATVPGTALAGRLSPCEPAGELGAALDTAAAPFSDGANRLRICARDFGPAGNETCRTRVIRVDNTPPSAAFVPRDRDDPELIRARTADRHSGPAAASIAYRPVAGGDWTPVPSRLESGAVRARVDSASAPAGRYRFRVAVTDAAGNVTTSTRRADDSEHVLRFPLRDRVRLRARLAPSGPIAYGRAARLRGRLLDARGRPLSRERIIVSERFEPGSIRSSRARVVRTGRNGRFGARLRPGPSRRVIARFAGSRRHLPASARPLRLGVRGMVRLRADRRQVAAGKRVRFRGRVGRAGARIPGRGKVVELQVRPASGGRYRTVRQALHSDRRGRIRTGYSFDRFYTRRARFQFRLKLTRQAGWPYRAPAHSRPRTVTVRPR